ncbi:MAG: nucleotide exchange factor GrpE [Patescibacteria group bacterium]|jgi:molecular chaperone GrpE
MEKQKKNKKPPLPDLQAQCDEYLAGWKRALADYENLKKDLSAREVERHRYFVIDLIQSFFPIIDNFDVAVRHIPKLDDLPEEKKKMIENWLQGVVYIQKQFVDSLASLGIERMKTMGEIFDPTHHDAAGTKTDPSKKPQEILEEVYSGWMLGDQVIRPAKVIINE